MFAAKQIFLGRCANANAPTARDYVQDGLIAMWDGIENAGWGVHDQNAATWVDLSGSGNDLSVTSPAYFDSKSFHVNRVYRAAYLSGNFAGGTVWTTEFCGIEQRNDRGIDFGIVGTGRYISHGDDYFLGFGQGGPGFRVENDELFSGGIVYNHDFYGYGTLHKNGNVVSSAGNGPYFGSLGSTGFGARGGYESSAIVMNLRLYSRAITAAEIAANYAIDKARFNLP